MTVTTLSNIKTGRTFGNPEYKAWHDAVLARDNGKCQNCLRPGTHAHHIEGWWKAKDKRFDVENGRTLCRLCHEELHGFKFEERVKQRQIISQEVNELKAGIQRSEILGRIAQIHMQMIMDGNYYLVPRV